MKGINLLNTSQLNDRIEKMFETETKKLIIVSPFLDINETLIGILASSEAQIYIFCRKLEKNEKQKEKLTQKHIHFCWIENLHAKIYMSVSQTIITSLNLYEYSQINNYEMGVMFDNNSFDEMYLQLKSEIRNILRENHHDGDIFDEEQIYQHGNWYNMKYLYRDLMDKYNIDWIKDYPDDFYYKQVCSEMLEKYKDKFKDTDYYRDRSALIRQAMITREMYDYGIKSIKLKKRQ
jgi:hypothetical protein